MKNNLEEEVKLMNLIRLLEVYGESKFGIKKLIVQKDKDFIKKRVLEDKKTDLLSQTLRTSSRIRLLNIDNKENWIRYSLEEKEKLRLLIIKGLFDPELDKVDDALISDIAMGNMIDAMALQSKSGWLELNDVQKDYLNKKVSQYKYGENPKVYSK